MLAHLQKQEKNIKRTSLDFIEKRAHCFRMFTQSNDSQRSIEFTSKLGIKAGKIHECCGPAKIRIAIMIAATTKGQIIWIRPSWEITTLNIDGISNWFSPERLLLINAKNKTELLYCTEEVLRSGVASVTIVDLPEIPNQITMHRFRIALKKGMASIQSKSGIVLILTPKDGGTNGVESRWLALALPSWYESKKNLNVELKQRWLFFRSYSRTDPPAKWILETTGFSNRIPPEIKIKPQNIY